MGIFSGLFICVLHTFGRNLKWNPHIHCLISEGGIGKSGTWKFKHHFNYKYLRDAFQTALVTPIFYALLSGVCGLRRSQMRFRTAALR
ncbi:MAG: transposase, partial [Lachnospiraceae bacterium]|nr:transposase [Lachnospiraceae bacterium]